MYSSASIGEFVWKYMFLVSFDANFSFTILLKKDTIILSKKEQFYEKLFKI